MRTEWNPVCKAMFDGDALTVRAFCMTIFSLDIDDEVAETLCRKWQKWNPTLPWHNSAGPAMWIKNRLGELGQIPRCDGNEVPTAETAILHCFFIHLQETQEMLARLRNDKSNIASAVARSKISSTQQHIEPIDAVASRVV